MHLVLTPPHLNQSDDSTTERNFAHCGLVTPLSVDVKGKRPKVTVWTNDEIFAFDSNFDENK